MRPLHVLFVCSQNRLRSPTAESVFSEQPGIECQSAGTNKDAEVPVSVELVEWADAIFVMESRHRALLQSRFPASLNGKRLVCLEIPDKFSYMEPALIDLLKLKVSPHLR